MEASAIASRLGSENVDTIIIAAVDMQGRLFGKRIPVGEYLRVCETGVNISSCALGWDLSQSVGLKVDLTGYHTGWNDFTLVPDLATLRRLDWLNKTALVFADIVDIGTGVAVPVSPRSILRRQVDACAKHELYPKVGTELEFFLFKSRYEEVRARSYRGLVPTTQARCQDLINRETNAVEPFFERLRGALIRSGIDVAFSESEWGYGQWEVNLLHHDPLQMADRQLLLKLAVKDIADGCGLSATFMAKPHSHDVGSSCHVHCSMEDPTGRNLFASDETDLTRRKTLQGALGGVLRYMDELMVWYAPTINAYRRTASQQFAGHGKTWGIDNRTVTCRVCGETGPAARFEFRVPGSDVNPYLALAGLVASARQGISDNLDAGAPIRGDGYKEAGPSRTPQSLRDAVSLFESSNFNSVTFGEEVVRHYAVHAMFEVEQFAAAVTDWERERYFEGV